MNKCFSYLVLTSHLIFIPILHACPSDEYGIYFVNDKIEQIAVEVDDARGNSLTGLPYRVDSHAAHELCVPQNQARYRVKYNPVFRINAKFMLWISPDILKEKGGSLCIRAGDSRFQPKDTASETIIR